MEDFKLKNIAIITNTFHPVSNANSIILENLAENFKEKNMTVTIIVPNTVRNFSENYKGMTVHYVVVGTPFKSIKGIINSKNNILYKLLDLNVQVILRMIDKIHALDEMNFSKLNIARGIKKIYKIIENEKIDTLISCYPSFVPHLIAKECKIKFLHKINWIAYYLDPFSSNTYFVKKQLKYEQIEFDTLKYTDKIILTDLMVKDFKGCCLKKYLDKCIPVNFPNISDKIGALKKDITKENDVITCVFIGAIYQSIRNPEFFIDLFKKTNKNLKVIFVGYIYNGGIEWFNRLIENTREKIDFKGPVLKENINNIFSDADILINIGNSISNQMPSKIFDYISSGKPIVNIYKLKHCPTLKYLNNYPLCLNIFEEDGITDETVEKFEKFCIENKGKRIAFSEIEKEYYDCTPKYVAEQFIRSIESEVNYELEPDKTICNEDPVRQR